MQTLQIAPKDRGKRLDKYLNELFPALSFNQICSFIRKKKVRVNGKHAKDPKHILQSGDALQLFVSEDDLHVAKMKRAQKVVSKPLKIDKIYEDDDLMVINKPIGLLVVPGERGSELSLQEIVSKSGGRLVHRLDRDTAGLMIVAKTAEAEEYFWEAFKNRQVHKRYQALCHGHFSKKTGTIDTPLSKIGSGRHKVQVSKQGDEAITHYQVLQSFEKWTLLELTIETGRTHQIRVHLASIGHPICFDNQYGDREKDKILKGLCKLRTHFLCATQIHFLHPRSGEEMGFEVEMPGVMRECLGGL